MEPSPALPKTLQCLDETSDWFGSTAVWSQRRGRYGVMAPGINNPDALGGHWATDAEVEGWMPLVAAAPAADTAAAAKAVK